MRLLRRDEAGVFSLAEYAGKNIPRYAILSHTWGADQDEVTFKDMIEGSGREKAGFRKLEFCAEQAKIDKLDFFWIDTCSIDKSSSSELSEAINSMFQWYQKAEKCYVFLWDLSTNDADGDGTGVQQPWMEAFQKSRWFTRGWTLQELVAPKCVEFFSAEGKLLGSRTSLLQEICDITGVAAEALQGCALSQFSVEERMSWAEKRETKKEEDGAYSLLGIFDIHMPLIYGEGRKKAFARLQKEIDPSIQSEKENKECIQHLRLTDPRDDKRRIEETKGGLLEDSYRWILKNHDFRRWRDDLDKDSQLLWVKGDPGKGKTMLLCGIVNELQDSIAKTALMSYFFCQATDSRINNATAVLRGLVYMLVNQKPSLISHVREKYDQAGKTLFEDANAWVALTQIFTNIVQDDSMDTAYLIIDALDECIVDMPKLLEFIVDKSAAFPRVKWIVSSRNWPNIEEKLGAAGHKVRLSLELNADSVSTAVDIFIRHKVDQLAQTKKYDQKTHATVLSYLSSNANDTFLWAALVCQNLEKISRWNILAKLEVFPPGLNALYEGMMQQISNSDDSELCKQILAIVTIVYQPITTKELTTLVETIEDLTDDAESLREIVGLCGSFLAVREDTIYFVHQSAKDFLLKEAMKDLCPEGLGAVHQTVFTRSLHVLSERLRRDIYDLGALGCPIDEVKRLDPDPLAPLRYSCIYWVHHFDEISHIGVQDQDAIRLFIEDKYLNWLEALSLSRCMLEGLASITKLDALIHAHPHSSSLWSLVRDARRFIMYHKGAIEKSPLQTYCSALFFSPSQSLIRHHNNDSCPKWITIGPDIDVEWGACLQTLEGHNEAIQSIAYSKDSRTIASASTDETAKLWDANSGECLQTFVGQQDRIYSLSFSHDSRRLATSSSDQTIAIWDTSNGKCLMTLHGHTGTVNSVLYSHDSSWLVSAGDDSTIKIWSASSGQCLKSLKTKTFETYAIAISHDSQLLASGGEGGVVSVWDTSNWQIIKTLKTHNLDFGKVHSIRFLSFSHDSTLLASGSFEDTATIWDVRKGCTLHTIYAHADWIKSVAFSHDSKRFITTSFDTTVKIWDSESGEHIRTLEGHGGSVNTAAFSKDSTRIASGSSDATIKIWDAEIGISTKVGERHSRYVESMLLTDDSSLLVSASDDRTIKFWDPHRGKCLRTLEGHGKSVQIIAFSKNSELLASVAKDGVIKLWDTKSGECRHTLSGHLPRVCCLVFSHNSSLLASVSQDKTARIWDTRSGLCIRILSDHNDWVRSIAFSHDSSWVATAADDGIIRMWDVNSGECLLSLHGHDDWGRVALFSPDSRLLVSGADDKIVKIWDTSDGKCLHTLSGHTSAISTITFLRNGEWLASGSRDQTVRIWDVYSGKCVKVLWVGRGLHDISPDLNGNLQTALGTVFVDPQWITPERNATVEAEPAEIQGWGLTSDDNWITFYSEKVLWLPSEYRAACAVISNNTVMIGTASGKVWIFNFDMTNLPPYLLEIEKKRMKFMPLRMAPGSAAPHPPSSPKLLKRGMRYARNPN